MKSIAAISLIASLAAGCAVQSTTSPDPTLHSASIETNQMKASFSAQSGDSNVKVFGTLFAKNAKGAETGITLDEGDSLTATTPGASPVALTAEPVEANSSTVTYTATLPLATAAEDITIALVREGTHVSAPSTVIHLTAPFTMTSPATTGSVKFGAAVDVKVTPPPATPLDLEAVGSCVSSTGNDSLTAPAFDDNGNGIIDTSQIKLDESSTCVVDLYLDELGDGVLDPAYAGGLVGIGDVRSEQRRDIKVTMTP